MNQEQFKAQIQEILYLASTTKSNKKLDKLENRMFALMQTYANLMIRRVES